LKSSNNFRTVAAVALGVFLQSAAWAWDATGHMLVSEIAWQNTKPEARAKVTELVSKLDNRFNAHNTYNFVTAACWMDDIRADRATNVWSAWHYVDIEHTEAADPAIVPPPPNVIWAIEQNLQTLRDEKATEDQQRLAMAMLLHFVGDIHQPLHCTDWDDKGGNTYHIDGVPMSDLRAGEKPNLHGYWDRAFRFTETDGKAVELYQGIKLPEQRPAEPDQGLIKTEADKIIAAYPRSGLFQMEKTTTPLDWAHESYVWSCAFTYPLAPHPDATQVVPLSPEYIGRAHAICCERIALAGYRLADLLNSLYAK
jgi:hypothetical protein